MKLKPIRFSIYILVLTTVFLSSCKIERPLVYSKDYVIGENDLLKFDGYYIDSELLTTNKAERMKSGVVLTSPLFFYKDGSVKIWPGLKNEKIADSLLLNNKDWGFTGIYQIIDNNLFVEYWIGDMGSGNLSRKSLVLKLTKNKLLLLGELNDNKELINIPEESKRKYIFRQNYRKPIIKVNWIRKKKKWNK
jgi:hypothetical protein